MLFGAWLQTTVPGGALTIPSTASTASTASTTSTASTASGADWDGACSGLPQDPGLINTQFTVMRGTKFSLTTCALIIPQNNELGVGVY